MWREEEIFLHGSSLHPFQTHHPLLTQPCLWRPIPLIPYHVFAERLGSCCVSPWIRSWRTSGSRPTPRRSALCDVWLTLISRGATQNNRISKMLLIWANGALSQISASCSRRINKSARKFADAGDSFKNISPVLILQNEPKKYFRGKL